MSRGAARFTLCHLTHPHAIERRARPLAQCCAQLHRPRSHRGAGAKGGGRRVRLCRDLVAAGEQSGHPNPNSDSNPTLNFQPELSYQPEPCAQPEL
eukprot:154887-Prymnesium_polylepis.3